MLKRRPAGSQHDSGAELSLDALVHEKPPLLERTPHQPPSTARLRQAIWADFVKLRVSGLVQFKWQAL